MKSSNLSPLSPDPNDVRTRRVFGVGMSKTGTTTLAECLRVLGFGPHKSYDWTLKQLLGTPEGVQKILREANKYRTFEDSPWYQLYRELDQQFPGSKFILTVRKDSLTHAKSSWHHGVRGGTRRGECSPEYLDWKIKKYEQHISEVYDYFKDRPADLLVVCWETGHGWPELCDFLGVAVPDAPFPHSNRGRYSGMGPRWLSRLEGTTAAMLWRRLKTRVINLKPILDRLTLGPPA